MKKMNVDYMAVAPVGEKVTDKIGKLTVKHPDTGEVVFEGKDIEYDWYKVNSLAQIFEAQGSPLTDDQVTFLGEVFPGDAAGKVIASLVELYNDNEKSKAYSTKSAAIRNQYLPVTEEDKAKAFERAIKSLVTALGISEADARAMVSARQTA